MNAEVSKVEQLLLAELECSVCTEYMQSPITLCEKGYSICKNCKPKIRACSVCRGRLGNIRCLALEKLANELHYPCSYRKFGCKETYTAHLIADHQAERPYSPYECPLEACRWEGKHLELLEHVKDSHIE
jgi:E3 ubiquitin-protein ligase SIAH1